MIRWMRKKDGSLAFDYATLDRYLDLIVKNCGKPLVHILCGHARVSGSRGGQGPG